MRRNGSPKLWLPTVVASAVLIGCASVESSPPVGWRVEPHYKVNAGGDPINGLAYFALGTAYQGEGRWREAAEAYARAVANDPSDANFHSALGVAQAASGRNGAAIAAFHHAIDIAPDRASLLNNMGYVLMLDNQLDRAVIFLRAALGRDPAYERARANLETIEARQALARAAAADAQNVRTQPAFATAHVANAQQPGDAGRPTAHVDASVPALEVIKVGPPLEHVAFATQEPRRAPESVVESQTSAAPVRAAGIETAQTSAATVERTPQVQAAPTPGRVAAMRLEIANGNGAPGAAARLRVWLQARGIAGGRLTNSRPFDSPTTQVQYADGFEQQAMAVARRMPGTAQVVRSQLGARSDVRVIVGLDVRTTADCGARWPCAGSSSLASASPRQSSD